MGDLTLRLNRKAARELDRTVSQQGRTRRLYTAWITLIPSKGVTLFLQAISVPTVYRAVGPAQFAAYVAVTSAVTILGFLNLGMGGALVTPLAEAAAEGDQDRQANLFRSTLFPIAIVAACAMFVVLPLVWMVPVKMLFGVAATTIRPVALREAVSIACIGTIAAIPLSVIDSVRQAYQEMHISNLSGMLSNATLCVGLLLTAWFLPTLVVFVAVMTLAPLVVRSINALLLLAKRPYLLGRQGGPLSWNLIRRLAGDGLSYMGAAAIANVFLYEWPVYYMARVHPAAESSTFAVYMELILLVLSFGVSLLQPLWPAVADACARGEEQWVMSALLRGRVAVISYGVLGLMVFGLGMNGVLRIWLHRPMHVRPMMGWLAGAYLLLAMWEYIHWPVALGLGKMRAASNLIFLRAAAFAVFVPLADRYGQAGVMAILCASVALLTAWCYPRLLSDAFAETRVAKVRAASWPTVPQSLY
jgi:O-antigen/teichoic acid export membrane protein